MESTTKETNEEDIGGGPPTQISSSGEFRIHSFLHGISILLLLLLLILLVILRKDPSPKCEMRQLHRSVAHRFCHGPRRCSPSQGSEGEEVGMQSNTSCTDDVGLALETDCFPHWTHLFPVHWAFYPSSLLVSDSSKACKDSGKLYERVVLPGNYGTGTQEVADWIGDWLLLDRTLQRVPSFGATDVFQLQGMRLQLVEYALSRYFPNFKVTVVQVAMPQCHTEDGAASLLRSIEDHGEVARGHVHVFVEEGKADEEKLHRKVLVVRFNFGSV